MFCAYLPLGGQKTLHSLQGEAEKEVLQAMHGRLFPKRCEIHERHELVERVDHVKGGESSGGK
jgi:hypothetical protein